MKLDYVFEVRINVQRLTYLKIGWSFETHLSYPFQNFFFSEKKIEYKKHEFKLFKQKLKRKNLQHQASE